MKDIIWLSPSLAAGAVAARLVVLFKRRPQCSRVKNSSRPHRRQASLQGMPPPLRECAQTEMKTTEVLTHESGIDT
jgi:hypothetical protein